MTRATLLVGVLLALPGRPAYAVELRPETVSAWNRFVTDTRLRPQPMQGPLPEGEMIDIPGGTIHHWRGSTLVRGTTVEKVISALMYPGTPPPQDDVLESRVIAREGNSLRVYLKLRRSAVVTVIYDTEHAVTFARAAPGVATSSSVSTRITEAGGGEHGFLWRLNSYWTYTQEGSNVRIGVESLSLSRQVPSFARPVASPLIRRIAREALLDTLASVRRFLEART